MDGRDFPRGITCRPLPGGMETRSANRAPAAMPDGSRAGSRCCVSIDRPGWSRCGFRSHSSKRMYYENTSQATGFNSSYPTELFQTHSHLRSGALRYDKKSEKTRWKLTREKRPGANLRPPSCPLNQFVDAVADALHGFAQLPDAPVGDVALSHVASAERIYRTLFHLPLTVRLDLLGTQGAME